MNETKNTKERLNGFLNAWCTMLDDYAFKTGNTARKTARIEEGRKYWKIIVSDYSRSVRAFIEKETGDIFKAATWGQPATLTRGNIFADDYGVSGMDDYGPKTRARVNKV
jgi:hypothetical protein